MLEKIIKITEKEVKEFEEELKRSLSPSIEEYNSVLEFICHTKGKRIRPIIGILTSLMLGVFSEKQKTFLGAVELIHNATLFHDDIIDDAKIRRNQPTLNSQFSNSVAVLSGDYFLSCAIKSIYSLENQKISSLFANYMKEICEGEIEQNLTLHTILPVKKYLEKTRRKTALLFSLTVCGVGILAGRTDIEENLLAFGENLGMIYQLQDDLKNFDEYENKPVLNDMKSGVYTAPIIFLAQMNKEVENLLVQEKYDEIIALLKKSDAVEKTRMLVKKYCNEALSCSKKFPENSYKDLLLELLAQFCQ